MAYSTVTSITGSSGSRRRRRRPSKPPRRSKSKSVITTPSAILGGAGVRKTHRAARSYRRTARRRDLAAASTASFLAQGEALARTSGIPSFERSYRKRHRTLARQRARAEREHWESLSTLEQLVQGGIVGQIDREASAAGRRAVWGSEDPSALSVAAAFAPIPGGPLTKLGTRALGAIRRAPGAERAITAALRAAPKAKKAATGVGRAEARASARIRGQAAADVAEVAGLSARKQARAYRRASGGLKPTKALRAGTRGKRVPLSARRRAAAAAKRKRAVGEYRTFRAPRSRAELGARAARQWRKRKPSVLTKAGRQVSARAAATTLGKVAAVDPMAVGAIGVGGGVAFGKGFIEDPGQTTKTTLRAVPSMATSLYAIPADVTRAAVTGDPAPIEGLVKQQTDYWRLVSGVLTGQGADVTDPTTGETVHHTPEQIVQEDVGLIPPISAAITGGGLVARGIGGAGVRGASVRERKLARLTEQMESPDLAVRTRAREKRANLDLTRRERHQEQMREAKRQAATAERIDAQFKREFGSGKNALYKQLQKLRDVKLTDKVSAADTVQLIGREGLVGASPQRVRTELALVRQKMKDPEDVIHKDDVATRDVIAALEENPGIASDPRMVKFQEGYRLMQDARSIERHRETKPEATTPDPNDMRAQTLYFAQTHGIPLPEERPLRELEGLVPPARPGVEARTAARQAATKARARAKKAKRETLPKVTAARRGAERELNVRKVSDARRAQVRSLERGLVTLEKRAERWAEKVRTAKTPELRDRWTVKLADLDRQITERRARLAMSTSPSTLRAVGRVSELRQRERGLKQEAEGELGRAREIESVVYRERRAASLDHRARRQEAEGNLGEAATLRESAKNLRAQAVRSKLKVDRDFDAEVRAELDRRGMRDPIYFRAADVSNRGVLNVMGDYPGSQIPPKELRNMGELAKQGRIAEAGGILLENAYRGRQALEMRRHTKEFLDERLEKNADGEPILRDGREWRQIQTENPDSIPVGMALYPLQEFNRVLQRGAWEEAAGLIENALQASAREARAVPGRQYGMVPKAALEEFRNQMVPYSRTLKHLRTIGRLQSAALLAASPAWFGYQLLASPLAGFVHHPNPVRWIKAIKTRLTEWESIPEQTRLNIQSYYGGTPADAYSMRTVQASMRPETIPNQANAAGYMLRSPVGRIMQTLANNARKGGPLIAANRRYEGAVRDVIALIQMDKDANAERVLQFGAKVGEAHARVARDLHAIKDKPLAERMAYYDKPENAKARWQLVDALDDAVGNWNALTTKEKGLAATTVFYPFLRFSLRWLLHSMPRNRPVTTGILMNLGQANAEELEKLLGGAPSFFPDWGNIVLHGSEGKPFALAAGRIAPGSNSIIESFGQSGLNLQSVLRPFQPVIGAAASALAGQDPLTGRPTELSPLENLARSLLAVPTPTRSLAQTIGPEKSVYSKLFDRIQGRDKDFLYYATPRVLTDLEKQREAVKASNLMDKAFGDNDPAARRQLEQMLSQYGLDAPENLSSLGGEWLSIPKTESGSEGSTTETGVPTPWRGSTGSSTSTVPTPWR